VIPKYSGGAQTHRKVRDVWGTRLDQPSQSSSPPLRQAGCPILNVALCATLGWDSTVVCLWGFCLRPQSPTKPVILSGAGTSRSEVPAESKDPYVLLGRNGGIREFSPGAPHIRVVCECVGAASAKSLAAYSKTGAESICTRRIISDPEIFRWRTNPHLAKYTMCGAPATRQVKVELTALALLV